MRFLGFKFNISSLLVLGAALFAAVFLIQAVLGLWGYFRLETRVPAHVQHWKVVQKASSSFAIKGIYTFTLGQNSYKGKTILGKPYHLNRLSAERHIQNLSKTPLSAWYARSDPRISSLEKIFPTKKCLYALMTLAIFLYFLYLQLSHTSRSLMSKNL